MPWHASTSACLKCASGLAGHAYGNGYAHEAVTPRRASPSPSASPSQPSAPASYMEVGCCTLMLHWRATSAWIIIGWGVRHDQGSGATAGMVGALRSSAPAGCQAVPLSVRTTQEGPLSPFLMLRLSCHARALLGLGPACCTPAAGHGSGLAFTASYWPRAGAGDAGAGGDAPGHPQRHSGHPT